MSTLAVIFPYTMKHEGKYCSFRTGSSSRVTGDLLGELPTVGSVTPLMGVRTYFACDHPTYFLEWQCVYGTREHSNVLSVWSEVIVSM